MRRARLNQDRCERALGVKLTSGAVADLADLAEYCVLYADPGAEGRRAPLFMAADFRSPLTPPQRADVLLRLVEGVAEVWRSNGGTKRERVGRLVRSLFKQAGMTVPAARTLRRAVQTVCN